MSCNLDNFGNENSIQYSKNNIQIYVYIYENYVVNIKGLTYILSDALYVLGFACDPVPRPPKFH